jgi:hypothetical protein
MKMCLPDLKSCIFILPKGEFILSLGIINEQFYVFLMIIPDRKM